MKTNLHKSLWLPANKSRLWLTNAVYTGSVFSLGALLTGANFTSVATVPVAVAAASLAVVTGVFGRRVFTRAVARLNEENLALKALHACELDSHKYALSEFSAVCVLDAENRVLEANREFTDLVGTTSSLACAPLWRALPDLKCEPFWNALKARDIWSGEVELESPDSERRVYFLTTLPQFTADGQFMRTLLVLFDRTAEKTGAMDQLLHATLEYLNEDVYVYDVETLRIRYMNSVARARCGWSTTELRERSIVETVPDFDLSLFRKHSHGLVTGEIEAATIQVMHARGPVEIVTRMINGIDNKRLFVSTLRDLSARQEIENARMQSVSMISHELRTPLTSIKGALALLSSESLGEIPPQAIKVLDIANRNSDRLLTMVNDILDYVKLQSGKMSFSDGRVDLKRLVTESLENMQAYAEINKVRLVTDMPEGDAFTYGDKERLMQVMVNLISNAAKFSPDQGEVTVSLIRVEEAWRLSVSDQGPGIPQSMVTQIGQPFMQFSTNHGKKQQGTGLGLTIVKRILRHYDSRLLVSSSVDQGSEFSFDLEDTGDREIPVSAKLMSMPTTSEGVKYGT